MGSTLGTTNHSATNKFTLQEKCNYYWIKYSCLSICESAKFEASGYQVFPLFVRRSHELFTHIYLFHSQNGDGIVWVEWKKVRQGETWCEKTSLYLLEPEQTELDLSFEISGKDCYFSSYIDVNIICENAKHIYSQVIGDDICEKQLATESEFHPDFISYVLILLKKMLPEKFELMSWENYNSEFKTVQSLENVIENFPAMQKFNRDAKSLNENRVCEEMPLVATTYHSLIIDSDGCVWCFGQNTCGQLGLGISNYQKEITCSSVPIPVQSVCGGFGHSLFLDIEGNVWGSGYNAYGCLGLGDCVQRSRPVQITSLPLITSISGSVEHSLFLAKTGDVWATGGNSWGQLGFGDTMQRETPVNIPGLSGIEQIACGSHFSMFIDYEGNVWGCGKNNAGELGLGHKQHVFALVKIPSIPKIQMVSCGGNYALLLDMEGQVWGSGDNSFGQLGPCEKKQLLSYTKIALPSVISSVSTGWDHSLFLDVDQLVWACGNNDSGQLGLGHTNNINNPTAVSYLPKCSLISTGWYHSLVVSIDCTIWTCGNNSYFQLGLGDTEPRNLFEQVTMPPAFIPGFFGKRGKRTKSAKSA